jgi:hypothetical protein
MGSSDIARKFPSEHFDKIYQIYTSSLNEKIAINQVNICAWSPAYVYDTMLQRLVQKYTYNGIKNSLAVYFHPYVRQHIEIARGKTQKAPSVAHSNIEPKPRSMYCQAYKCEIHSRVSLFCLWGRAWGRQTPHRSRMADWSHGILWTSGEMSPRNDKKACYSSVYQTLIR